MPELAVARGERMRAVDDGWDISRIAIQTMSAGVDIVGLAEHRDGTGLSLVFQRALTFDEQDRAMGTDTFCVSDEWGATVYGGVSYTMDGATLKLELSPEATAALRLPPRLELRLNVDEHVLQEVGEALAESFARLPDQPGIE
jgi:Immunity protein 10